MFTTNRRVAVAAVVATLTVLACTNQDVITTSSARSSGDLIDLSLSLSSAKQNAQTTLLFVDPSESDQRTS